MNYQKTAFMAVAGLLLSVPLWSQEPVKGSPQTDPGYAAYIAERKARLTQSLSQRIDTINQRFDEEMAFRHKLKDERIAFEKKMEKQESDFLDSLGAKDPQARLTAWAAYYQKTGEERETFYAGLKQESSQFWEARLGALALASTQNKTKATK